MKTNVDYRLDPLTEGALLRAARDPVKFRAELAAAISQRAESVAARFGIDSRDGRRELRIVEISAERSGEHALRRKGVDLVEGEEPDDWVAEAVSAASASFQAWCFARQRGLA